jgi:hypothetical protein
MKLEAVLTVVVQRAEKRNPLYMVPMKMGDEDVGRNHAAIEFVAEGLPQHAEPGAAIEDIKVVTQAHFYAGSIASVPHIFRLGSRRRSSNSPELNPHSAP